MRAEIENPFPFDDCFYCGRDNPEGLQLRFYWDEERQEASTEYLPTRRFAGQGDILHGAIQMGLLDEIMGWTSVVTSSEMTVTTDLNVRFLSPVYICGDTVRVACRVVAQAGRTVELLAELTDREGVVCTTATGAFRVVSAGRYASLIHCERPV